MSEDALKDVLQKMRKELLKAEGKWLEMQSKFDTMAEMAARNPTAAVTRTQNMINRFGADTVRKDMLETSFAFFLGAGGVKNKDALRRFADIVKPYAEAERHYVETKGQVDKLEQKLFQREQAQQQEASAEPKAEPDKKPRFTPQVRNKERQFER